MSERRLGGVGAVVVNYDAGPSLGRCVASLRAAGLGTVVVVDNGSHDGSLASLARADADAVLVPLGRNVGYASAVNRGVQHLADAIEAVLVCNPDLVVEPDAVSLLWDALVAHAETAAVGPTVRDPDGRPYPSARQFPDYKTAVAHGLLGMFLPDNRWSRAYRREDALRAPGTAPEVDWVSGACMLVRKSALFSVGGFDEGYFMYVEDLDLCWRLRRAGWSVRQVPSAQVVHVGGVSAARHPYRMIVAHHRSTWRFARKRVAGPGRALLPLIGAGIAARGAVALTRRALRSNPRPPSV